MDDYKTSSKFYDFFLEPFVHHIRKDLVKWIVENKPENILDLGCGTGKQLSLLPKDLFSWGLDVSVHMLEQASKNIPEKCLKGDVAELPFLENSFDLVYSQFALHEKNLNMIRKGTDETKRILNKNGKLIIVDFAKPSDKKIKTKIFGKGISFVEKHAGDEHFQNYQTWMEQGGIDQVITSFGWTKLTEYLYYSGTIKLVVFEYME
jgi:ubiquinone/menaquinone biosynthesis C-methylase UbiE